MIDVGPTLRASKACADWLAFCLKDGWPKDSLDDLQAIWWRFHDDDGKLCADRTPPAAAPVEPQAVDAVFDLAQKWVNRAVAVHAGARPCDVSQYEWVFRQALQASLASVPAPPGWVADGVTVAAIAWNEARERLSNDPKRSLENNRAYTRAQEALIAAVRAMIAAAPTNG